MKRQQRFWIYRREAFGDRLFVGLVNQPDFKAGFHANFERVEGLGWFLTIQVGHKWLNVDWSTVE